MDLFCLVHLLVFLAFVASLYVMQGVLVSGGRLAERPPPPLGNPGHYFPPNNTRGC
ncbi:hypothetical protein MA16_Dca000779 [Dendrobium catenatum]|uniref:Uncharacterized protein n=1 Tax=Dendrobium catenatum TaxID=906689 RepID=A0A2I0WUU2_9ASPA|nr:hypothetical protein MA16_Dca000779 [Dendrobium catenatum]